MARLKVVMTAGGTREPLDDVRHISNVASGTLPAAIGNELLGRGVELHYIHGPGAVLPGQVRVTLDVTAGAGADVSARLEHTRRRAVALRAFIELGHMVLHPIQTAADANRVLRETVTEVRPDVVLCAMAVADYAPVPQTGKVSSTLNELTVRMRPTEKTIDVVKQACPETTLIGFKLLSGATETQRSQACAHLAQRSGATWVVCNDMQDYRRGVRRGWLYTPAGEISRSLGDDAGSLAGFASAIADVVQS